MSELDEAWALALAEAEAQARAAGRKDISEYLALRTSNDLLRKTGSDWLLNIFTIAAGEANRAGGAIQISTDNQHRFKVDHAGMVGRRLSLENGVRVLTVEVCWPRTPRDGFIRGGGLACGNIKHRGIKLATDELRLVLSAGGTPTWMVESKETSLERSATGTRELHELHEADVKKHVALLVKH